MVAARSTVGMAASALGRRPRFCGGGGVLSATGSTVAAGGTALGVAEASAGAVEFAGTDTGTASALARRPRLGASADGGVAAATGGLWTGVGGSDAATLLVSGSTALDWRLALRRAGATAAAVTVGATGACTAGASPAASDDESGLVSFAVARLAGLRLVGGVCSARGASTAGTGETCAAEGCSVATADASSRTFVLFLLVVFFWARRRPVV